MLTLSIMAVLLVLSFVVSTMGLRFAAHMTGSPPVGRLRAALVVLVLLFVGGLLLYVFSFWRVSVPQPDPWMFDERPAAPAGAVAKGLVELAVGLFFHWFILCLGLRVSYPRAMLISLPWIWMGIAWTTLVLLLFPTFIVQAFVIPTNAMSPSLPGLHHHAPCPACGGTLLVHPGINHLPPPAEPQPRASICSQCFKTFRVHKWQPEEQKPTRMLCNKLLSPQRFDAIVFKYPREPSKVYVMRLFGLPGEKVTIKEGSVWINGERLELPAHLKGLQHLSWAAVMGGNQHMPEVDVTGKIVQPEGEPRPEPPADDPVWELSAKGYFVLGDFSSHSSDSRDWGEVPAENIVGVASVIYWPPSRWQLLR